MQSELEAAQRANALQREQVRTAKHLLSLARYPGAQVPQLHSPLAEYNWQLDTPHCKWITSACPRDNL